MALEISALVAPLADDRPSGPDLYGDFKRQQIEQAFERSISDGAVSETSAAQWQDAIDLILEQAGQTRDLWLPVYLMRAAAQSGQFDMVVEAGQFLAALIDERWDDVHPQLEDLGFIGRKAPCESLTRIGDFLGPLERMPLVVHPRLGAFSGADFERYREQGGKASGFGEFRMALDGIGAEGLGEALAGIEALDAAIHRVDAVLTGNADGDTATNFKPTYDLLAKMRKAVGNFMPGEAASARAEASLPAPVSEGVAMPDYSAQVSSGGTFSGSVSSRDDVVRAIDAICAYYVRSEPGSPVPFVLRRARDWISLDFMSVLEDIAPGSLEEATRVLKSQKVVSSGGEDWGVEASEERQDADWSSSENSDDGWG